MMCVYVVVGSNEVDGGLDVVVGVGVVEGLVW